LLIKYSFIDRPRAPQARTVPAIVKQITKMSLRRGGLLSRQPKKSIVTTIEGSEIISREALSKPHRTLVEQEQRQIEVLNQALKEAIIEENDPRSCEDEKKDSGPHHHAKT